MGFATFPTCSLALWWPCVAARSWCFELAHLSRGALPFEAFPSSPALRCVTTADTFSPLPSFHAACMLVSPPARWLLFLVGPTSRSCSDAESVAATRCCHLKAARCSLGLVSLKADVLCAAPRRSSWRFPAPGSPVCKGPEGSLHAVEPCGRSVAAPGLLDLRGGTGSPRCVGLPRFAWNIGGGSVLAGWVTSLRLPKREEVGFPVGAALIDRSESLRCPVWVASGR
jgi:hypothetical protein